MSKILEQEAVWEKSKGWNHVLMTGDWMKGRERQKNMKCFVQRQFRTREFDALHQTLIHADSIKGQ